MPKIINIKVDVFDKDDVTDGTFVERVFRTDREYDLKHTIDRAFAEVSREIMADMEKSWSVFKCPGCGIEIKVSPKDLNKTVVCVRCQSGIETKKIVKEGE